MGLFSKSPLDRFAPSLLDRLPLGVVIYRLDDLDVPPSLRVLYANQAGARFAGFELKKAIGRRLVDVAPEITETGLLDRFAKVVLSQEHVNLGTVRYGATEDNEALYHIEALPLEDQSVAVVFEDVAAREEVQQLREAEAELSRGEARYRSLVEASAAVVWTTSPSGAFEAPQPHWLTVTGQTEDEAQGMGWLDAVHPDDRDTTAAVWRQAVEAKTRFEVQHRLRQADGSYRSMAARATPVFDGDGVVAEWIGVHSDIEEQAVAAARLAESEARLRTLFDAISDVVLLYPIGPDGPEPFVLVNEAAVEAYGYTRDQLAEMTVEGITAPDRVDVASALAELRRTRRATFDSLHVASDNQRIPMSVSARLIEYDGRLCVLALCRDDTERRAFRRELSRNNHSLERAVEERTAQLEAFAEDLKILHRITTSEHDTAAERLDAYLQAGCQMFDLPVGILSSTPIDLSTGERLYRIESVVSPSPEVKPGLTIPLSHAFCDAVVARGETVVYGNAEDEPEAASNPACADRGFRAFVGTPVRVDGELYGTLNFVSTEPRPEGFAPYERDLIEVMADTIGRYLGLDRARRESRSGGWYEAVVDTLHEGLLLIDKAGQIVRANPAGRRLLGLEPSGSLRETRWEVVREDGTAISHQDLPEQEAIRTGQAVRDRVQGIVDPDGGLRWYVVNATPVDREADDTASGAVVSFVEVTELREARLVAEQTGRLLRSVLGASLDGIMAFRAVRDEAGAITDFEWTLVNPRAEDIVGRCAEDLLGHRMLDVFPGNRDAGLFDAYVGVVETGRTFQHVVPYRHDGFDTSFRIVASPIAGEDGFTVSFVDVIDVDVTEAPLDGQDA